MVVRIKVSVLAMIIVSLFVVDGFAADWPQWRGPNRDGVWQEKGIVEKFASPQLPVRWRAKIANGYCGPTVTNGLVYVTDRLASPTQLERVHCFDAMTGKEKWSYPYECIYKGFDHRDGPRASVTIEDNRAYSLGAMGHLFCFDAAKGNVLWSKDLYTEYKMQIGGKDNACLLALDKVTGKEKWRALKDSASYSAPIVINQAGKRVLVCWTGERVVGLDFVTGKLYWQQPFAQRMVHNIASPVFKNGYLFVSSFFDGSLLLRVNANKLAVEKLWQRRGPNEKKTDALHCCISTPVLQGGYIYGVDSYGELRCLDLQTGDRIWESLDAVPKNRWANVHMVRNGDKIWMFNERGELIISKLSPQGFGEISRAKLIKPTRGQLRRGVCWSHPAFAYRHIYIRNDEELICADLSVTVPGLRKKGDRLFGGRELIALRQHIPER
jgi:outer membrane protein assembly factor BamB